MNIKTILRFFKKTYIDADVYPPLTAKKQEAPNNNQITPTPQPAAEQTQK